MKGPISVVRIKGHVARVEKRQGEVRGKDGH